MKRSFFAGIVFLAIAAVFSSVAQAADSDRVGLIVVKDQRIKGTCWLPIAAPCPSPHPGVIRGIINWIGSEEAVRLGIKKRFLTRRTYSVPVVTNDEVCARAKNWIKQFRKDGRPKLWNWDRAMSFELSPALKGAMLDVGSSYYIGIDGVFVGDYEQPAIGSNLVLNVRPDLVKSIRGLCK